MESRKCKRRHHFYIDNDQVIIEHIPRSEMAPEYAIKALFEVDDSHKVIAAEHQFIQIPVGTTLAVVPANEKTKRKFDEGSIGFYIGDADQMSLAHANYLPELFTLLSENVN